MTRRPASIGRGAMRFAAVGSTTLVLLWLAWQIVGNTAGDTLAAIDPAAALSWRGDSAPALVRLGEERLAAASTDADLVASAALARQALLASPLQESALRLLGLTADLGGRSVEAEALLDLAGRRSLRDPGAHMWLFHHRLNEGKFAEALGHADAILRTQPDLSRQILPSLAALTQDSMGQVALQAALGRDPPWRGWFLRELVQRDVGGTAAYAILSGLERTPQPPRPEELRPYLDRLVDRGQFDLAFLTWLHFLPKERSQSLPYLFNGDFEWPVSGLAFDWVVTNVRGASIEVAETGNDKRGPALRVVFGDTRVPFRNVAKLLVLPPGGYRLDGLVKPDNLESERGMVWRISCAEGKKQMLGESEAVKGTADWRSFETRFEVPANDCRGQWLRLELAARVALEQQVSGAVWYDQLVLSRETADTDGAAAAATP